MKYALFILLTACSEYYEQKPYQEEATELVWGVFPTVDFEPPLIEWREDCGELAGVLYNGTCYSGLYFPGGRALVAWRGGYTVSAFAHELLHANQWFRGFIDYNHESEEWSLVEEANEVLKQHGIY